MEEPIKILIVDDHALLRRGLTTLLGFDKSLSVAGDAKNGAEAVKAALKLKPDVVVMDLSMPVMDGVEATRRIREALPSTRVLILTTYSTSVDVARAMKAGASGAFVKDADDDRLIEAIHKVMLHTSHLLTRRLCRTYRHSAIELARIGRYNRC